MVIDPVGYRGPAAWDIAQLAGAAEGRGQAGLLPGLLAGHGSEPPFLAELFAWQLLAYLNRNLAAGGTAFSRRLLPVAEMLLEAGDPTTFSRRYRAQYPVSSRYSKAR